MTTRWIFRLLSLLFLPVAAAKDPTETQAAASAVAQEFFNAYVLALPTLDGYEGVIAWVRKNPLASAHFQTALQTLYRDALREDPELGYGADAILGAQDYPEAFEVKSVKVDGNQAMVELVGRAPFPLPVRALLKKEHGQWLVEASGDLLQAHPQSR